MLTWWIVILCNHIRNVRVCNRLRTDRWEILRWFGGKRLLAAAAAAGQSSGERSTSGRGPPLCELRHGGRPTVTPLNAHPGLVGPPSGQVHKEAGGWPRATGRDRYKCRAPPATASSRGWTLTWTAAAAADQCGERGAARRPELAADPPPCPRSGSEFRAIGHSQLMTIRNHALQHRGKGLTNTFVCQARHTRWEIPSMYYMYDSRSVVS